MKCAATRPSGPRSTPSVARQEAQLELIASENHTSAEVIAAMGTVLTNKYAEGYPGRRYYGGCEHVDTVEELAPRARRSSSSAPTHANVQPHSGTQANIAALMALCAPRRPDAGDVARPRRPPVARPPEELLGRLLRDPLLRRRAATPSASTWTSCATWRAPCARSVMLAGASAYPRTLDFPAFASIAAEVGAALLLVDMAHIAGLVAAGVHPTPVPHADVSTMTTHKTLRGPRGGLIVCGADWIKQINSAIFPGGQGGPFMHVIAAKAVALREALAAGLRGLRSARRARTRAPWPRSSRRAACGSSRAARTTT